MKVTTCIIIIITFMLTLGPARGETEQSPVEKRLASALPPNARWALVVLDQEDGREIVSLGNALATPLVPGSLMKLFVTGAVLDAAERDHNLSWVFPRGERLKGTTDETAQARLHRLLRDMNVHSRNRTAQRLFLLLGTKQFGQPATPEKGVLAIERFLESLELPAGELKVVDGSGLGKANRVTTGFIARYLFAVSRKPWYPAFRNSLPRPGLEGTVKDIGYTNQRFRVKTGKLDNMFAIAGFGAITGGRPVVFAYIVNIQEGKVLDRRHTRGTVIRLLAEEALR